MTLSMRGICGEGQTYTTAINAQSAAISHSSCLLWVGFLSELMLMFDTHIIMMPPTQSASANKSCRTFRDVTNLGTVNEVSVTARISQLSLSIAIAHYRASALCDQTHQGNRTYPHSTRDNDLALGRPFFADIREQQNSCEAGDPSE